MNKTWLRQLWGVIRLEVRMSFLSKVSIWLYLLALAPLLILVSHRAVEKARLRQLRMIAATHPLPPERLRDIYLGMEIPEVIARLGQPYRQWMNHHGRQVFRYTDGRADIRLIFSAGQLIEKDIRRPTYVSEGLRVLGNLFNWYFLRIAIFFGCAGIFTNIIRGKVMDKTLHLYLLCPVRREVLILGKYLAALVATAAVFNISMAIQWLVVVKGSQAIDQAAGSLAHKLVLYLAVTTLACIGYGGVFMAVGLLFKNTAVPTAVILVWEHINQFMPGILRRLGMVYYLQSVIPATDRPNEYLAPMLALLISPAEPVSAAVAVLSICTLSLALLALCGYLARRLQVNYATE